MYESPIKAYFGEVETQFDGAVFKAVQSVGIDVNKDELIKALAYDREQYERGYHDGLMFHPAIITNADRIRAMTDEELLAFLNERNACLLPYLRTKTECEEYSDCKQCWLDWLKQEAPD